MRRVAGPAGAGVEDYGARGSMDWGAKLDSMSQGRSGMRPYRLGTGLAALTRVRCARRLAVDV